MRYAYAWCRAGRPLQLRTGPASADRGCERTGTRRVEFGRSDIVVSWALEIAAESVLGWPVAEAGAVDYVKQTSGACLPRRHDFDGSEDVEGSGPAQLRAYPRGYLG